MDSLRLLLVQNQNNLDKLRARARYCTFTIVSTDIDIHKQYGPYCDFWDEWLDQAEGILLDVRSDLAATAHFVSELRAFIILAEEKPNSDSQYKKRANKMKALAEEALLCQVDMLHMADERIAEHQELTHRLLMVEAMDNQGEE